jgi:hypothetical protein
LVTNFAAQAVIAIIGFATPVSVTPILHYVEAPSRTRARESGQNIVADRSPSDLGHGAVPSNRFRGSNIKGALVGSPLFAIDFSVLIHHPRRKTHQQQAKWRETGVLK